MKVLFADEVSLYRYSTILVARECRSDIEPFEADNILDVLDTLRYENISVLLINVNLLGDIDVDLLRSIPDVRTVLVIDSHSRRMDYERLMPYVYGVFDLDSDLEVSKKYLRAVLR